jgi:transposase
MAGKRKRNSADFKAKVALEALRGEQTTAKLASKHGIHQTNVLGTRDREIGALMTTRTNLSKPPDSPAGRDHLRMTRRPRPGLIQPRQHIAHRAGNPQSTARRLDALRDQFCCHLAQRQPRRLSE